MKKLALLCVLLAASFAAGQSFNINFGGIQFSSGGSAPAACSNGSFFYLIGTGWEQCVGNVYVSMGGSGGGAASSLAQAVTANASGSFITTPTPPAAADGGFGFGNVPCASFDSNGFFDEGCGAITNFFGFLTQTPNSFRHGYSYRFQTDTTQANNPIGMTVEAAVESVASGQVASDVWSLETTVAAVGGYTYTGNAETQRLRVAVAGNTTQTGELQGAVFYNPTVAAGSTLNGGIDGYACDTAAVSGTVTGGYVCVLGGTIIGSRTLFGSNVNPAFGINNNGVTTADAYCWGSLAASGSTVNIYTPTICIYQGSGSPQGVLTANIGSVYTDTTNGNLWEKNSGTGSTGWVEVGGTQAAPASYGQSAASSTGGTCAMVSGTTCTLTIGHTYNTPVCTATEQGTSATVIAASCGVSGATVTVTAASSNSATFGAFVLGNPN